MNVLYSLVEPRQTNEEARRQEFILNILLLGSISLTAGALLIKIVNDFSQQRIPRLSFTDICAVLLFLILYKLSRSSYPRLASFLLIFIYAGIASFVCLQWGILLPQGLLIFALTIVMAGVLLGSQYSLFAAAAITIILTTVAIFQNNGNLGVDSSWMDKLGTAFDGLTFGATFSVIALVSWLSNREITRSLARARRSEAALMRERDLLEEKVEERTKDLKQAQTERISQLYRFAEFGRSASNIIHDLVNPLNAVSLNLEKMQNAEHSRQVNRAMENIKRMEQYIEEARKQIHNQRELSLFILNDEISQAIATLQAKAKRHKVSLQFSKTEDIELYGNQIRFQQLASNLIANAIDSYDESPAKEKQVLISLEKTAKAIFLRVQDFGSGISQEDQEKIFQPFFTTKSDDKGTGLGLAICQDIVEKEYGGTITLLSEPGTGTIFSVEIPLDERQNPASRN